MTGRYLWHGIARLFLVGSTLAPIYFQYLWFWARRKYFGRKTRRHEWKAAHEKNAEKFYQLAVRMKGGLIKVGQLISARVDVVPRTWTKSLSRLQDKVTPAPWKSIEAQLVREYGRHPEEIFESIEHEALAAASFGQVHKAITKDGKIICLKIRYPDLEMKLAIDLFLFGTAVYLFNLFTPLADLRPVYREMREALQTELDYEQEAEYTRTIHENMKDFPQFWVPAVLEEYTTRGVICTEFFDGYKITNFEKMNELGIARRDVLEIILNAFTKMMYEDGIFQSDPHPGNLMFRMKDGKVEICLLDFGQVKIMPKEFHAKLLQAVFAFLSRDVDKFLPQLINLGVVDERNAAHIRPILKDFFTEYFELSPKEARQLDFRKIREDVLETLDKLEGIVIPNDIVLYGRTFSLISGLATQIDHNANMFLLAKPFLMKTLASMQQSQASPGTASTVVANSSTPS